MINWTRSEEQRREKNKEHLWKDWLWADKVYPRREEIISFPGGGGKVSWTLG